MEPMLNSTTGDWIADDKRDEADVPTSSQNNTKPNVGGSALKDCTVRPEIIVGQKIPDEIHFNYEGGGGWTNMGSFRIANLFEKHIKTFQEEMYEFSEICRNENEKKAFELAINENCKSIGLNVIGYVS